jgi:2',3'-cyclic-nucleotide 2'-phosphodiesterase (5'-nucleotidase family)
MTRATVTILHTNDFHGHLEPWTGWEGNLTGKTIGGLAHLATAIKQVRQQAGPDKVLLLDAGDAIGDTLIAAETKGQAVLEVMEALRYDALAIGNHEPDFSAGRLRKYMQSDRIPLLAANVRDRATGKPFAMPFIVREAGGVQVGVLGLGYPNTPLTTARKNVADLEFRDDSAAVVREYLPQLRDQEAEIIVVLSHLGLGADLRLAKEVKGIDLIVGGHSHNRMAEATRVADTLIVQAGAHGSDLGRVDLVIENGKITKHRRQLVLIDNSSVPADPEIAAIVKRFVSPLLGTLDERIAEAVTPIVRAQTLAGQHPRKRDRQSPVDCLFADIIRERTGSDIALLPGVGYGVAIPPGPITAAMLRNLLPHESQVVSMDLSGQQIVRVLEQAVENTFTDDPMRKVGGMIQVSGVRFAYEVKAEPFRRVREVRVGGAPLEPQRTYRVSTNSMLAAGGHRYAILTEGQEREEHGGQYEMVSAWMRQQESIHAPDEVRLRSI